MPDPTDILAKPTLDAPVDLAPGDDLRRPPDEGTAVCLSGGGYRAMLFHAGSVWRLAELGYLAKLDRVSSVSGGSILAATLGLEWNALEVGNPGVADRYRDRVVAKIRNMASETIDADSILKGIFGPGTIPEKIRNAYREHLFGDATLQALPDHPRFVINATNVQSGVLCRFSKPYMRDYRVGEVKNPEIALAIAVAASSAFPPFLSPLVLDLPELGVEFEPGTGVDLQRPPFTREMYLTDGGVYDNLGLETAWKRYRTVLVSDGGGATSAEEEPKRDWARHSYRVLNLVDRQVRSLRKRQLISSYQSGARQGAYWGIRTDIANYQLADCLDCPVEKTLPIADTPTRLKALPAEAQMRLINWGYAVCDAAVRKHAGAPAVPAPAFPYPTEGVG